MKRIKYFSSVLIFLISATANAQNSKLPLNSETKLIAYSKVSDDLSDIILVVVNLDPRNTQAGWISVALKELNLGADEAYQVHDLLTEGRYVWRGSRNFVQLDPAILPAHIFRVHPIG